MADDFVVEEETSNRTFLYAVVGMAALLVIGLIAIVVILLTRRGGANNEIAIMNQTIAAQNAFVTQTVEAMEAAAAFTPTPAGVVETAEVTRIPTFTPSPALRASSPTPLAQTPVSASTGEPAGDSGITPSPAAGTPVAATPTPTPAPAGGELPASGLGMWGAVVAGVALIVVIVLARRLRPAV